MQVKKQQLEPDMEKRAGSKLGQDYIKAVYCHPAYLTYMHSTSWEMPGWMKHKLESRWPGETAAAAKLHQLCPTLCHCTTREDLEFFKKYFIPLVCWICRYRTHTYGRLSIIRTLSCFLSLREAPHIRCWNHDFIMFCGIYSWVTKERIEDNLKNICKIKTWG